MYIYFIGFLIFFFIHFSRFRWTPENFVLSQAVINQDGINKNLPFNWIIDWRKTLVYNCIAKSLGAGQPTMKEVLMALETLEESEQIKKQIEKMKGNKESNRQRDNKNENRSGPNSKCRKEGCKHLWKDCPDNPRNKNGDNNRGRARENNANERTSDNSGNRESNKSTRETQENNAMVQWDEDIRFCNLIERAKDEDSIEEMPFLEDNESSKDEEDKFKPTFLFKGLELIDLCLDNNAN